MNRKTILNLAAVALLLGCAGVSAQIAISGLPNATTPLVGTEVVPIVQSGVTKKVAVSNLGAGAGVTWPTSLSLVVSNGTSSPAGLAPTDGNCVVGSAGAWASLACPGGTAANPTATIGASAVNGVATTYMRSDAAPALPATLPALNGSNLTSLTPANLASAVPVNKGGTNCTAAALSCLTAITGTTGTPSGTTFLRGDNVWATPAGSGNVTGPGSSVSGNVASFSGTSGTIIQDTGIGSAALVTLTGSQTLTNKTLTSPAFGGTVTGNNTVPLGILAQSGANTMLGNWTSGTANVAANAMPSCPDSGGNHLNYVTNTGITCGTSSSGGGSVSVTSASPNIVINPTPGTGTFTIGATYLLNAQTGTSYTILTTDLGKLVTFSNASAIAVTLPQATGSFGAGASFDVQNKGAGAVTITPSTSTINGAATLVINQNQGCTIVSDGTNWQVTACTALGGSGSGTVSSATGGQLAWYSSTGTTVSGNANITVSASALTVGQAGSSLGSVLLTGNTSGTITIKGQAAAGTYNFNLPTGAGSNGECLKSGGGGSNPMTFASCGGGSAGMAHPGYVSGRYYTALTADGGNVTLTANRLYALPFSAGATQTFTKLGIRVSNTGTATACQLGYYANNNGSPGTLGLDAGNVSVTSTGYAEITGLSMPFTAGGTYWLAFICNGTVELRSTSTAPLILAWMTGTDDPNFGEYIYGNGTYGALPGTFPTVNMNGAAMPLAWVRF